MIRVSRYNQRSVRQLAAFHNVDQLQAAPLRARPALAQSSPVLGVPTSDILPSCSSSPMLDAREGHLGFAKTNVAIYTTRQPHKSAGQEYCVAIRHNRYRSESLIGRQQPVPKGTAYSQ